MNPKTYQDRAAHGKTEIRFCYILFTLGSKWNTQIWVRTRSDKHKNAKLFANNLKHVTAFTLSFIGIIPSIPKVHKKQGVSI